MKSQLDAMHVMSSQNMDLAHAFMGVTSSAGTASPPPPPTLGNVEGDCGAAAQPSPSLPSVTSAEIGAGGNGAPSSVISNQALPIPQTAYGLQLIQYSDVPVVKAFNTNIYPDAAYYYRSMMGEGGNLPDKFPNDNSGNHKAYAEAIHRCFNAMATEEEKLILLPPRGQARSGGVPHAAVLPDEGKRNAIQVRLKNLVIAGLVELFVRSDLTPPINLAKHKKLLLSSPHSYLTEIGRAREESQGLGVPTDLKAHFQSLRLKLVAGEKDEDDLTHEISKDMFNVDRLLKRIPNYEQPKDQRGGNHRKKKNPHEPDSDGKGSGKKKKSSSSGGGGGGVGEGGGGPPPAGGGGGSIRASITSFFTKNST